MVKKLDVEHIDEGAAALLAAGESPLIVDVLPVDEFATGDSTATAYMPPVDILPYLEDVILPVPVNMLIPDELLQPNALSTELQVDETPNVEPVVRERNTPAAAVEPFQPRRSKRLRSKDAARRARDGALGEKAVEDGGIDREMLEMPDIDGESPQMTRQRLLLSRSSGRICEWLHETDLNDRLAAAKVFGPPLIPVC
jgi:hypothetical protein